MSNEDEDLQSPETTEETVSETEASEDNQQSVADEAEEETTPSDEAEIEQSADEPQDSAPAEPAVQETPVEEPAPVVNELPAPLASLRQKMDQYLTDMGPGVRKDEKSCVAAQMNLLYILRGTLMLEEPYFRRGMQMLMDSFSKHRNGLLGPRMVFRYMDKLKVTPEYLKGMQALINLLMATADAGSRELALKQVDLKKVVDRIQPPEAAARLLSFYDAG